MYLDLRKAYDYIDRNIILRILQKYKMGHNIRRYISQIWDKQPFVLSEGGFYSNMVDVDRRCTQGDTDSSIILNIIGDAVIRNWKSMV